MGYVEDVGESKATARALHESLIMFQCRTCGSTTHCLKERPSPLSSSFSDLCPSPASGLLITLLFAETVAEKKYCWYFEGDYPVYFVCKTYEDCCGTQCCVRDLSVQRIWYFWLLLIIGILCCCSTGYFIRRRVHPYPPPEGPDFNVSFTRHPNIAPGLRQAGFHNYGDSETAVLSTVYPAQTHPGHMTAVYSALPPYYSQPPPSYDRVMQDSQKKETDS